MSERPPTYRLADGPPTELICPVCRRRQPITDACDRCGADLTLLRETWDTARREWERWREAVAARDPVAAARHLAALELLAPPETTPAPVASPRWASWLGLAVMLLLGFGLGRLPWSEPVPTEPVAEVAPEPVPEPEPEPYQPSWERVPTGDGWVWRHR